MAGDDFPAWGGVVGDSLTSAATAYLKAINDQPFEKEELEKARLSNARLRSQIELEKAHADYYRRPQKPTGGIPDYLETTWGVYVKNPESGQLELKHSKPADAPKTLETIRAETLRGMEERMGQKYGLPHLPISAWKGADFNEPFLDPLRDFVGIGRSPLVTTPGGPGAETRPKRDIGGYGGQPADAGTAPAPRTPSAVTPDAAAPRSAQPPAAGRPAVVQPGTAKPIEGTVEAPPALIELHEKRWRGMTQAEADKQFEVLRKDPKIKREDLASALEAYHRVYGVWPKGFEVQDVPAPGATPPSAKPSATTPAAVTPPKTPGRREIAPVAPPPPPPDWGRNRTTPLNNEQLAQVASDAYKLDLQYRQAQAQELEVERKNREEDTKNELRALGGEPTPEIKEMTIKLNAAGKVNGKDFTRLQPDEQKLVIDTKNLPKLRKEEQSWKKLAQPSMDELDALQTAQDLTTAIIPLIQNGTVGFLGKAASVGISIRSYFLRNRFYAEAEARMRATPEGRALLAKLGDGAVQAQIAADVETNDPAVRAQMRPIATRARLQTLSSVLMYAHALAQKRITGGSTRGLIKPDMEEAHKLFDPDLFFSAPEQLMANLQELQGVIQASRKKVAEKIASFHFDPVTRTYQAAEVPGEAPSTTPAMAPVAPSVILTPDQLKILQEGAQ